MSAPLHRLARTVAVLSIGGLLLASPLMAANELVSSKMSSAPAIDGTVDAVWNSAKAAQIALDKTPYKPSNGFPGLTKATVTIKSLHDGEYVYFLVQYDDPTESLARYPWVKQGDGGWKRQENKDDTGHENTYYEDKFAMLWDINTARFDKQGCAAACHKARDGKIAGIPEKVPARKYTNKAGETIDMWHWKGVRSNPVGLVDDQYIDDTKDPTANRNWGRKSDTGGGGYKDNVSEDKKMPAFMPNGTGGPKYWMRDADKVAFQDSHKPGDVVPAMIVSPFQGSRADIEAAGVWANGKWTIEMKRKLVTTGENADTQDVQFKDLKRKYPFGVAVFDNTQINHVYHEKPYTLSFK